MRRCSDSGNGLLIHADAGLPVQNAERRSLRPILTVPSISLSHKIIRNTAWNFFSRLIHLPINILLIPFIIHHVGEARYGIWVALFAFVDYVSLLDFGIGAATIKYVADYHTSRDIKKIGQVIATTSLLNLIFMTPLVAAYFWAEGILNFFPISTRDLAEALFVFRWILVIFAVGQFASVFRNILIGLQHFPIQNLCEIIYIVAYALATMAVLGSGAGLRGMIIMLFCLRCGLAVSQISCVFKFLPGLLQGCGQIDVVMARSLLRFGMKLQLSSLAGLINFQLDKLLIGHFLKMEFVAYYELGAKLAMLVRLIPSVLMGPLLPASAELAVRTDTVKLKELYLRGTRYIALIAAPAAAFLVVMAPEIMKLWLGERSHAHAELALQLLAISYFFNILTGAVNSVGRGIGVLTYELQATGLMTALNLGLSLSLVILFGYAGALIGTAAAMTIGNSVYLWRFSRFMGTTAGQLLATVLSKPLGCACLAGASLYGLHYFLLDTVHWIAFSRLELAAYVVGAGGVYLAVFTIILWMTKFFTRADAETLHQLLTAVRAA